MSSDGTDDVTIRIGVMAPASNYIPFLARDLPRAIELAVSDDTGPSVDVLVEPAGYNAERTTLVAKAQHLLINRAADVVVAPLNPALFEHLAPHFSGQRVPLIALNLGEDVVADSARDPFLFVDRMELWKAAWLSGYWGVRHYGKKACAMAGFHDAGYGMAFAFAVGVEAAGGHLEQIAVTHRRSREEDPAEDIATVALREPDFVFGLYAGKEATSFLDAYASGGWNQKFPLVTTPFAVEEAILDGRSDVVLGVHSVGCWASRGAEHSHFAERYREATGNPENAYALLAYEAGHLIRRAAERAGGSSRARCDLRDALTEVAFEGPRGIVRFGAERRETTAAVYLRRIARRVDGALYNEVVDTLEPAPEFDEHEALARRNLQKQGWINPYLCA